ncbi:hypothetical protein lerEdw1_015842 [Lerista edwardsae]|nr:hypothetical protein lerEdw1_015842 [Lerista edwardsae]
MFSALKKLVGSEQGPARDRPIPAGLQSMNQALQRRFAKGVQYNMKIVIRGDRNTGKTTLWHRLQGKKFVEEYIPTQEIQVTSIHWNYKTTDDIVKVEVWDVVDKGKSKKRGDGLKLENDPQAAEAEMALDAEFLDVYKNCNGVVMMFDITKQWTFNYILKELPKVPSHVPVCVLGNYRDMGEHRVVLPDDMREFIDSLNRPPGSSYFRYAESSMKNSFGLKYLHKFFNIPFLQLQRETLLRQLETNQLDIDATLEELSVQQETEDQNYEIFLEMMEARSRGHTSPLATNGQSPSSGSQSPVVPLGNASGSSSPSTPQLPLPLPQLSPANPASSPEPAAPPLPVLTPEAQLPPRSPGPCSACRSPPAQAQHHLPALRDVPCARSAPSAGRGLSRGVPEQMHPAPPAPQADVVPSKVPSVEDFVPEDSLDRSFLDEPPVPRPDKGRPGAKARADSDSPDLSPVAFCAATGMPRGGNPLVAGFQDDLDVDDCVLRRPALALAPSQNVTLSSEEEEAGGEGAELRTRLTVMAGEDLVVEPEAKRSSRKSLKPAAASKAADLQPPAQLGWEQNGGVRLPTAPAPPPKAPPQSRPPAPKQKGARPEESDSDPEGPIATQMLSFVMDDPDFESEESDSQQKKAVAVRGSPHPTPPHPVPLGRVLILTRPAVLPPQDAFPVREELSDLSDEDASSRPPQPARPAAPPFKPSHDADLFGLGLAEPAPKESSGDDKEKKPSKEKKKKKKKESKEEEGQTAVRRSSKHRKGKEKEEGTEEKERKRKKKRSKDRGSGIDELEAFLGGGAGSSKQHGGGDYEEL